MIPQILRPDYFGSGLLLDKIEVISPALIDIPSDKVFIKPRKPDCGSRNIPGNALVRNPFKMNKFMEQGFDLSEIVEDDDSSSFELILSNLTAESAKLIVFYKWKYGYLGVDYNCRVAPALPIENIEPTDPIEPIDINPTQRDR